ncbi:hypothetical protein DQ04_04011000, partial [Trypanosoma grayi]|uniref:hypothetical protein n=1 Tax=Trypanosoma grayi TaxID=71804 RepID=UPI0004F486F3
IEDAVPGVCGDAAELVAAGGDSAAIEDAVPGVCGDTAELVAAGGDSAAIEDALRSGEPGLGFVYCCEVGCLNSCFKEEAIREEALFCAEELLQSEEDERCLIAEDERSLWKRLKRHSAVPVVAVTTSGCRGDSGLNSMRSVRVRDFALERWVVRNR